MGENVVFIQGEQIDLVVKNIEHIKIYHKWVNDPIVRTYVGVEFPETLEVIKKEWFSDIRDEKNIWLEIWHKENQIPVGLVGFFQISNLHRRAELGIIIGESEYWGKGIGTEAINLIINYGFNTLNYRKILASVNTPNIRSLGMCKKIGFIEEGHQKDMDYIDGKWTDIILLGIFKKDR